MPANRNVPIVTIHALRKSEKIIAGTLLIVFILLPAFLLTMLWPNELPEKGSNGLYCLCPFRVSLIDQEGKPLSAPAGYTQETPDDDSTSKEAITAADICVEFSKGNVIHLNTLLMILVSLAGFLGAMFHIASSFTNYVGSDKFERSWILWYFVKPFSGAGLALIFYFVFRAGLLNFNDPSNINLFGLVTLSALTGLFTDKASLKLEEFFAVLFKPKDDRPDKIQDEFAFETVAPKELEKGKENVLTITGKKLNTARFTVLINDVPVAITSQTETSLTFSYTIPQTEEANEQFQLSVTKENGDSVFADVLTVKSAAPASQEAITNAPGLITPADQANHDFPHETDESQNDEDQTLG